MPYDWTIIYEHGKCRLWNRKTKQYVSDIIFEDELDVYSYIDKCAE